MIQSGVDARLPRLLALVFFLSGFCGLVDQIVWVRLAFASFGIITPVLSVVVSVFMAGLAVGSAVSGRVVEALRARGVSPLVCYAVIEIGVGIGGLVVPVAFKASEALLLDVGASGSTAYLAASAACIAVSIFPWCVLMGATFPVMISFVRGMSSTDEKSFSLLYAANVGGAFVGALASAFVMIELLGFRNTLLVASTMNGAIAFIALTTLRRLAATPVAVRATTAEPLVRSSTVGARALLFTTGFCSMAMEVVWTRDFAPVLGTQVYSFAALLAVYLLATFLGTQAYRRDVRRGVDRGSAWSIAALAVTAFLPVTLADVRVQIGIPDAVLVLASIAPFCAALGYLTPRLVDERGRGRAKETGRAYAWNVFGCIVGPLFAGYVLLPTVGAGMSLVLLGAPFVAFLLMNARALPRAAATTAVIVASAAGLFGAFVHVDHEDPTPRAQRAEREIRRDHTATVVSLMKRGHPYLLVNGEPVTSIVTITKHMAVLPLLSHEGPVDRALTICFGMGSTWRAELAWGARATAVELVPSVVEAFPYYWPDAQRFLDDPRGEIVVDDGRRFLQRTDQRYDVVAIDPPPPIWAAGSGLLYSDEMYALLKLRLNDGAVVQQWFPTAQPDILPAVARSIVDAFPYVRAFRGEMGWGIHFLASNRPIRIPDRAEIEARLPHAVRMELGTEAVNGLMAVYGFEVPVADLLVDDPSMRITDDLPLNEYRLLRSLF